MSSTQIKYVGLKEDGEAAFHAKTGITWYPGASHAIPSNIASEMLRHPDVFAIDGEQVAGAAVIGNTAGPQSVSTQPSGSGETLGLTGDPFMDGNGDNGGDSTLALGKVSETDVGSSGDLDTSSMVLGAGAVVDPVASAPAATSAPSPSPAPTPAPTAKPLKAAAKAAAKTSRK